MWDIVDYMRDDEGRRTKFDRNGRGTDVNGCDRSGANRWGLPSGLSIESISGMEQEEIDERMMEVMEQFIEAPGDQLQFDASPAERMLRTYISYKAEPDMTEDKVYERMIYRVFGERITTITDREKDAIKKLMKATIRVAKEMGEDVRGITEQGVKEKQAEVDERIRIASNLSTKAKQALEQGIKVEKIITDMENDFEEEIDGK